MSWMLDEVRKEISHHISSKSCCYSASSKRRLLPLSFRSQSRFKALEAAEKVTRGAVEKHDAISSVVIKTNINKAVNRIDCKNCNGHQTEDRTHYNLATTQIKDPNLKSSSVSVLAPSLEGKTRTRCVLLHGNRVDDRFLSLGLFKLPALGLKLDSTIICFKSRVLLSYT